MNPPSNPSSEALTERLESLEELLESPLVPGEMRVWLEGVRDELRDLEKSFAAQRGRSHRAQFDEIEQTDGEMFSLTEKLREEDDAIASEISRLASTFATAVSTVETVEERPQNDEGQVASVIPPLVADALALVIRIRMQEKAIATWFVEAFQRDRGIAD